MADSWWNKHYKYRKNITFDLTRGDITGHPAAVALKMIPEQGKVRADLEDIRIVMNNVTVIDIDHYLISHSGDGQINIIFEFPDSNLIDYGFATDSSFYIYYGDIYEESPEAYNPGLPVPDPYEPYTGLGIGNYTPPNYPEFIYAADSGGQLGLTRPGEDWVAISVKDEDGDEINSFLLSPKSARDAKVSYSFYGYNIGIFANVGPGYGIMRVEFDGKPEEIDLYQEEEEQDVLVYRAYNFTYDDMHSINIFNTGFRSLKAATLDSYFRLDEDLDNQLNYIPPTLYEPVSLTKIGINKFPVAVVGEEETVDTFSWNSKIGGII